MNLLLGTCRDNICHVVEAPAEIPEKMKKLATSVAEKAIKSLEGAGVFAVELFLTNDNQVCLNIYVYVL
jgi:phosphoribosylaminoimidazole carboxylase